MASDAATDGEGAKALPVARMDLHRMVNERLEHVAELVEQGLAGHRGDPDRISVEAMAIVDAALAAGWRPTHNGGPT